MPLSYLKKEFQSPYHLILLKIPLKSIILILMNSQNIIIKHHLSEFKGYDWATDNYSISYHGFTVSHMDGLAHLGSGRKII